MATPKTRKEVMDRVDKLNAARRLIAQGVNQAIAALEDTPFEENAMTSWLYEISVALGDSGTEPEEGEAMGMTARSVTQDLMAFADEVETETGCPTVPDPTAPNPVPDPKCQTRPEGVHKTQVFKIRAVVPTQCCGCDKAIAKDDICVWIRGVDTGIYCLDCRDETAAEERPSEILDTKAVATPQE